MKTIVELEATAADLARAIDATAAMKARFEEKLLKVTTPPSLAHATEIEIVKFIDDGLEVLKGKWEECTKELSQRKSEVKGTEEEQAVEEVDGKAVAEAEGSPREEKADEEEADDSGEETEETTESTDPEAVGEQMDLAGGDQAKSEKAVEERTDELERAWLEEVRKTTGAGWEEVVDREGKKCFRHVASGAIEYTKPEQLPGWMEVVVDGKLYYCKAGRQCATRLEAELAELELKAIPPEEEEEVAFAPPEVPALMKRPRPFRLMDAEEMKRTRSDYGPAIPAEFTALFNEMDAIIVRCDVAEAKISRVREERRHVMPNSRRVPLLMLLKEVEMEYNRAERERILQAEKMETFFDHAMAKRERSRAEEQKIERARREIEEAERVAEELEEQKEIERARKEIEEAREKMEEELKD